MKSQLPLFTNHFHYAYSFHQCRIRWNNNVIRDLSAHSIEDQQRENMHWQNSGIKEEGCYCHKVLKFHFRFNSVSFSVVTEVPKITVCATLFTLLTHLTLCLAIAHRIFDFQFCILPIHNLALVMNLVIYGHLVIYLIHFTISTSLSIKVK